MNNKSGGGTPVLSLLGIAFVILKLCGVISWLWIWVLAPFWVWLILVAVAAIIGSRQ